MTAGRVILWRHGRTTYNHDGRFQGQFDAPLDAVGLAQAAHAASFLVSELASAGSVTMATSDLSRASSTAAALASRLGVVATPDERLREVYAGRWQGLLRAEIQERWPAEFAAWVAGEDVPIGGGETRAQSGARAAEAIRDWVGRASGNVLVLTSHGAALSAAVANLIGLPAGSTPFMGMRNCHWADLALHQGVWRVIGYNLGAPGALAVTASEPPEDPAATPHGPDLETGGGTPVDSASRSGARAS